MYTLKCAARLFKLLKLSTFRDYTRLRLGWISNAVTINVLIFQNLVIVIDDFSKNSAVSKLPLSYSNVMVNRFV